MKDKIIEKQREYIKHLKIQLKMKSPAIGTTSYNFESELSALESEPDNCSCGNPSKEGLCHFEGDEKLVYVCVDCKKPLSPAKQ